LASVSDIDTQGDTLVADAGRQTSEGSFESKRFGKDSDALDAWNSFYGDVAIGTTGVMSFFKGPNADPFTGNKTNTR
jgi:hypothetical protein